ncbi:MAG: pilus assembly PilX family protein [Limnohabitans sp.]
MTQPLPPQQGLALPTLMVVLSVASLAALLAWRNLGVNDQLLNAEADQLRTQRQAEAVLPLAVQDIVSNAPSHLRHTMGSSTDTHAFFPNTLAEYAVLQQRVGAARCQSGICVSLGSVTATPQKASDWKAQTHTAIAIGAADSPYGANTAWYWVEVFPGENTGAFVYRVTTLAQGVLPSSTSVLQAIWQRDTSVGPTSLTGKWHSWHALHD